MSQLQLYPVYLMCNRRKTLTGSPDPMYMQPANKPCIQGLPTATGPWSHVPLAHPLPLHMTSEDPYPSSSSSPGPSAPSFRIWDLQTHFCLIVTLVELSGDLYKFVYLRPSTGTNIWGLLKHIWLAQVGAYWNAFWFDKVFIEVICWRTNCVLPPRS